MIYDPKKNKSDIQKARTRLDYLIESEKPFELKEIRKKRSIDQNSYYHKLCQLWGASNGYDTLEAKKKLKEYLGYTFVFEDEICYISTSEMNTKQLSIFIEKIRNYSSQNGLYLPSSEEYLLNHVEYDRYIYEHKLYL